MMYDFYDMDTLAATAQDAVDSLDYGQEDVAEDFAKYVLSVDVPYVSTLCCHLYSEENAVLLYAQLFFTYNREMGVDSAVELLAQHVDCFADSQTPLLTKESAEKVMQMVCSLFPYAEKVIGDNPIDVLLIEAQHKFRNGESTAVFTKKGMEGSICIYQLQENCTATPEHILLHELGHLLHIKTTGTLTDVPPGFREYLSQLGMDCSKLSKTQLQEVFADTFMLAVLCKHPALGVPIPGIANKTLDTCYEYILTVFDKLHWVRSVK